MLFISQPTQLQKKQCGGGFLYTIALRFEWRFNTNSLLQSFSLHFSIFAGWGTLFFCFFFQSCDKLYKVASYLGFAHTKVEEFVKKYVPIAIEKGKNVINDFPNLMKELAKELKKLWCDKTPFCFNNQPQQSLQFGSDDLIDMDLIKQKIKECKLYFLLVLTGCCQKNIYDIAQGRAQNPFSPIFFRFSPNTFPISTILREGLESTFTVSPP